MGPQAVYATVVYVFEPPDCWQFAARHAVVVPCSDTNVETHLVFEVLYKLLDLGGAYLHLTVGWMTPFACWDNMDIGWKLNRLRSLYEQLDRLERDSL